MLTLWSALNLDEDLANMYLTAKAQDKPRANDDHEEIELLLESFSKQCEEIVSEVETLEVGRTLSSVQGSLRGRSC